VSGIKKCSSCGHKVEAWLELCHECTWRELERIYKRLLKLSIKRFGVKTPP